MHVMVTHPTILTEWNRNFSGRPGRTLSTPEYLYTPDLYMKKSSLTLNVAIETKKRNS